MATVHASPAPAKPADLWPAWTDRVAFWPVEPVSEAESFGDDLHRAVFAPAEDAPEIDAPGTDGDYTLRGQ